jgi:hypothetical protein
MISRQKIQKLILGLAAVHLFAACATTIRDVPTVHADQVDFQGFPALDPAAVKLEVIDERDAPVREHSDELRRALTSLLEQVLTREKVSVNEDAPQTFSLRVRQASRARPQGFAPERCVTLQGRIERAEYFFAEATGTGCHVLRHVFGFTMGGDISQAYRMALDQTLGELRAQLERLPARAMHPRAAIEQSSVAGQDARLTLQVRPAAADVYVDGKHIGIGDVVALPLASGAHALRVTAAGAITDERIVQLAAGEHLELGVELGRAQPVQTPHARGSRKVLWGAVLAGVAAGVAAGVTVGSASAL